MRWQTLPDLEEMWRLDKDGLSPNQSRYPKRGTGKAECCVTADQWLDRYAGWCEPFQVRITPDACKLRRNSELSDFCKGCKGIRKRSGKPAGSARLS